MGARHHGDGVDGAQACRWWAATGLIPVVLLVAAASRSGAGVGIRLSLAGTPRRWTFLVEDPVAVGDVRVALAVHLAFAVSFAVIGALLLRAGWRWWAPQRRRRFGWWKYLPAVAAVAGLLDVVDTTGRLIWLDNGAPPSPATHLVVVVAWWKWTAYAVSMVGVLGLVVGPIAAPVVRPTLRALFGALDRELGEAAPRADADGHAPTVDSKLGICASGGGIRSASVMTGALRGLSDRGAFQRARWLHAVSGGGFTAGGWRVSSVARHGDGDGSGDHFFDPDSPYFASVRHRRRYLDNGWGSLVGGILGAVVRTVAVFGGVLAAATLIGWSAGRLTRSWAVHPAFSNLDGGGATTWGELTAWRVVLPGAIPLALAVVAVVVAHTRADETFRRRMEAAAAVLGGLGGLLLIVLVAVPIGIRYGRPMLAGLIGRSAEANAGYLGLLSAIGVVAAVRQLLTSELKRRWSRLGGVALASGLFLLAGKVADDEANLDRFFSAPWVPIVAIAWLILLEIPPSHRLTLNGVYRKRLAGTFCLGPGDDVPLPPVPYSAEPPWSAYSGSPGPELVLCGTSHSSRRRFGGLRSFGFTFRPGGVTLHDGASAPWRNYPRGSWWDGYPRGWIVSRSMALAGAAFASAMGRQSFGTTNSLLAAVNLRLGMWVPNPRFPEWFVDRDTSPRVHLGYFAKELFSRYDPDRDAFVYVADGGHRENLGLVEQLREQPAVSIVLDASGDTPGSFTTLKQAVVLADNELGVEIDIDFAPIQQRAGDEPLDCVTTGLITYPDGTHATLLYAKAQISESTPLQLRQFAAANPPFPDYSTGDQYLAEDEFDMLVALGVHMAQQLASLDSSFG